MGFAPAHRADIDLFPYWCFLITGPVLFVNTIIHLVIGRWFTGILVSSLQMLIRPIQHFLHVFLDSSQTHFLTAVYLVMGGGILYSCGLSLFQDLNEDLITEERSQLYLLVEWVGAVVSVLFLVSHLITLYACTVSYVIIINHTALCQHTLLLSLFQPPQQRLCS